MLNARKVLLVSAAVVGLNTAGFAAVQPTNPAKVFDTAVDVNCAPDDACAGLANITVNKFTVNGATTKADFTWQGDRISCISDYYRPAGTFIGQFCRRPVNAASLIGVLPVANGGPGTTTAALLSTFGVGITLPNGYTVATGGRTANGDGGGGIFAYDATDTTTADNSCTVRVDGQNRRWKYASHQRISAQLCGVTGDGSTDDTVAVRAAQALGRVIYYPPAPVCYKISDSITMSSGGIEGDTLTGAKFCTTSTGTADIFTYTGTGSGTVAADTIPIFRNFQVYASTNSISQKSGGFALHFNPRQDLTGNTVLYLPLVDNVQFWNLPNDVKLENTAKARLTNSSFFNYTGYGVWLSDANNTDTGEDIITGNTWQTSATTGSGIVFQNGGGIRATNNFINGGSIGVNFSVNAATSDFLWANNMIENQSFCGICMSDTTGGTATFQNITITGSEFANVTGKDIYFDGSGIWGIVTVNGNVFRTQQSNHTSVHFTSGKTIAISGNSFDVQGVGSGTGTAIQVDASASEVKISGNSIFGVATKYAIGSATAAVAPTGSASDVLQAGQLGLGRAPTQLLDVYSAGSTFAFIQGTTNDFNVGFILKNASASGHQYRFGSDGSNGAFVLRDDTTAAIDLTVDNTGNLIASKYVSAKAFVATGTAPTLTGTCTTASQVGGNTAGTFTATCSAQTVVITFATTAPNGWVCNAHDWTTPADTLSQTGSTTTSCTLTGTTVAADRIGFNAVAY